MKVDVEFNDDAIQRVKERLEQKARIAKAHRFSIGIHEADGAESKDSYAGAKQSLSVATVASYLEFGSATQPERSYIRSWFDSNLARFKREAVEAMRHEYEGHSSAVEDTAQRWNNELVEWIKAGEGNPEPLAAYTIEERTKAGLSASPPRFATGQLVRAIKMLAEE